MVLYYMTNSYCMHCDFTGKVIKSQTVTVIIVTGTVIKAEELL